MVVAGLLNLDIFLAALLLVASDSQFGFAPYVSECMKAVGELRHPDPVPEHSAVDKKEMAAVSGIQALDACHGHHVRPPTEFSWLQLVNSITHMCMHKGYWSGRMRPSLLFTGTTKVGGPPPRSRCQVVDWIARKVGLHFAGALPPPNPVGLRPSRRAGSPSK